MSSWKDGLGKWLLILNATEKEHDIPSDLLARICWQESRGRADARSAAGAVGLMQLEPKYFPGAGRDGSVDIETAGKYISGLYTNRYRDWQLCLAAYNWGPGSVDGWRKKGLSFAQMPRETRNYVIQILQDVPVKGVLWDLSTLDLPATSPDGIQQQAQSAAASLGLPPRSSLWHSVTNTLRTRLAQSSQALSQLSVLPLRGTFSKMVVGNNSGGQTMTNQSLGQMILSMIEGDLATNAGASVVTLFQNLQKHAGNGPQQAADILSFTATAPALGLTLEVEVEQQLLALAIKKIQSAITPTAPSVSGGSVS